MPTNAETQLLKRCKTLSYIKYFYYLRNENKSNKDFVTR